MNCETLRDPTPILTDSEVDTLSVATQIMTALQYGHLMIDEGKAARKSVLELVTEICERAKGRLRGTTEPEAKA